MEKYGVWNVSSGGWCFLCPKVPKENSVDGLFGTKAQVLAELKSFQKEYPNNTYMIAMHHETCDGSSIVISNCCAPIFLD
jgi:hypothetical protein